MAPPTQATTSQNTVITFLLALFLVVSLFPGLFHLIWSAPLALLSPYRLLGLRDPQAAAAAAAAAATCVSTGIVTTSAPTTHTHPHATTTTMSWFQKQLTLPARSRGSYLVTDQVVDALPELREYRVGLLNLFMQHTSCALSLNENWDEDVRADMSDALDKIAPEVGAKGEELYRHNAEGRDDMPAHIKSALIGASVTIPIKDGKLATGTWQGIWYLEFRTSKHQRKIVATIQGERS